MKPTLQAARIPIGEVGADGKVYLTRAWMQFFLESKGVTDDAQTRIDEIQADSLVVDLAPPLDLDMFPDPVRIDAETDMDGRLAAVESALAYVLDKIEDLESSP